MASRLEEALVLLRQGADLVICGIHFDDSRMFDLLRLAKADPGMRAIPFLCFRDLDSQLPAPFFESVQIACPSHGAIAFVDLFHLKATYGVQEADRRFRRLLLDQLSPP